MTVDDLSFFSRELLCVKNLIHIISYSENGAASAVTKRLYNLLRVRTLHIMILWVTYYHKLTWYQ